MSELSIKVNIAGRTYPLTIQREEEEFVRKAADRVNANIKQLQTKFNVTDKIDLLAMTAMQFANQSSATKEAVVTDKVIQQLRDVEQVLSGDES